MTQVFEISKEDMDAIDRAGVLLRELISTAPSTSETQAVYRRILWNLGNVNPKPKFEHPLPSGGVA